MTSRSLAVAVCALAAAAAPLRAQPADATATAARRAVLDALSLRETIRIETPMEGRLAGRYLGLRDGRFLVEAEGTELTVPVDQLRGLWVRGNHAGIGALVGGVAGAVAGAAVGAALADFACAETDRSCGFQGGVIGGLIFGAGGAGVGALVGLAVPRWARRYP